MPISLAMWMSSLLISLTPSATHTPLQPIRCYFLSANMFSSNSEMLVFPPRHETLLWFHVTIVFRAFLLHEILFFLPIPFLVWLISACPSRFGPVIISVPPVKIWLMNPFLYAVYSLSIVLCLCIAHSIEITHFHYYFYQCLYISQKTKIMPWSSIFTL